MVWSLVARFVAAPLLRNRERWAAGVTLAAAFVVTLTLGAGIVQHVMYPSPEAYLGLMRSEASGGATGLYMAINPMLEWVLVPAALALAWRQPTRRLMLATASLYYVQRLCTYLYFAPTVLGWKQQAAPGGVQLWLNLDVARMAIDVAVAVLLATVALRSASGRRVERPQDAQERFPVGARQVA